ncbi:hypothetical protein [Veillonella intestinalis]|uniref:hypothetical protein n=1 Tax=Veillonella intestinalis TaxID=2941341 RepID=UPI00203BE2B2|nr:hypothetical protein [Veillonella intestinalis]
MGGIGRGIRKIFKPITRVVGGILGLGGSQKAESNPVQIPQPTVTATQLVPQTEAVAPEAPELGTTKKKKKTSRKSLMIDRTNATGGSGGNPLNM